MVQSDRNSSAATDQSQEDVVSQPPQETAPQPPGAFPPLATRGGKLTSGTSLAQNKAVLIAGGAVAIGLLLFVFASAPKRAKTPSKAPKTGLARQAPVPTSDPADKSVFPVVESTKPQVRAPDGGLVGEQDIAHTAKRQQNKDVLPVQTGALGSVPPFDANQANWQAPTYPPPANAPAPAATEPKTERERPSIVFVRKVTETASRNNEPESPVFLSGPSVGLPVGTRLRARLESAVSTALKAPVIAVVEYNYEEDGEIVVPAGAKALGRIEGADRTGYMSLRFDALLMPDGTQTNFEAVATNLRLGPLRGKVEGKNTGKNLVVRSLSGIGELGALVVGRNGSSLNQPFSEGDLIREQVSTNVAQSADQTLLGLTVSEHIVVSVFANTPIYLILDRPTKQGVQPQPTARPASTNSGNSVESLRQLLQLQRELNQSVDSSIREQSQPNSN